MPPVAEPIDVDARRFQEITDGVAVPILVQFFIKHILIGFGLAAVFVGMLLGFDVMGLRGMIAREEYWPSALFNLCFGNATVIGAVQVAYAVMCMAED